MRTPNYAAYPQPRTNLLQTYAQLVGKQEHKERTELESSPVGSVRRNSLLTGRACMMVLHHNEQAATRAFGQVIEATRPHVEAPRNTIEREQQRLNRIATMLAGRNNPLIVRRQRLKLHDDIVQEAAASQQQYEETWLQYGSDKASHVLGAVGEHTTTAVLGRLLHPWMIALPALSQHDRNAHGPVSRSNYDAGLIETGPYSLGNQAHKLQIKVGCIGICGEPGSERKGHLVRQEYAPDITLVSGHCDLGMRAIDNELWTNPLLELLAAENEETATPDVIHTLDRATNALLWDISMGNPLRMGTASTAQPAYANAA